MFETEAEQALEKSLQPIPFDSELHQRHFGRNSSSTHVLHAAPEQSEPRMLTLWRVVLHQYIP